MGLSEVSLDENGYLMATLEANVKHRVPTVGFIAHYDTSPDFTAQNVSPQWIYHYDGGDIVLNAEQNIVLNPKDFEQLSSYVGKTLITTNGLSLLGADDKAGIAEILTAMEFLIAHPEIKHGKIRIGFTPDEEIGRGADRFDVQRFGANYAYTLDGGPEGELEYENFNAAGATIRIQGRSVHPGTAKNKLINSQILAMELHSMLPVEQRPELTEGYEGFFMLAGIHGTVDSTEMRYIIRHHDARKFARQTELLQSIINFMNTKYGPSTVTLTLKEQYRNMREMVEPVKFIVDHAEEVMRQLGIEPLIKPIRGGTDGARLSFMGLPTPNLFTGGHNYHGRYEYAVVETMELAVQVVVKLAERYALSSQNEIN
jgi:tripeptide aminopeptidase